MPELKEIYNNVYKIGKENFHSHSIELIYSEVYKQIRNYMNNKHILDLGCGDGSFLLTYCSLQEPKEMVGYDFSDEGIKKAKEMSKDILRKYRFEHRTIEDMVYGIKEEMPSLDSNYYDIITSIGVIEHLSDPENLFKVASNYLKSGGLFVLEYPNFMNLRGVIWKTLEVFFGAEMSKTDKWMIMPDRVFTYMSYYDFECEKIISFDYDRGMYSKMIEDFSKRLKLALNEKVENLDGKIKEFFMFLNFVTNERVFPKSPANGAEIIYVLRKK